MIDPIFQAMVDQGRVVFLHPDQWKARVASLEGKEVDVIIRKHRKSRTNSQNRYYWVAVVGIPAQHFGYLPEEMHDAFKMLFLRQHDEGKPETVRSTTSLSTVEFSEYVEKCRRWCAEEGIIIPDPSGIYFEENYGTAALT